MTQNIIEVLKNIDNTIAKTLVSIVDQTLPAVEDAYYETTVYKSKQEYTKNQYQVRQAFTNHFTKELVETPLTFVRGNLGTVWNASAGTGITAGTVLIDYRTKNPLLLIVIDKNGTTYRYQSAKYNTTTNTYDQLTNKTKAAKSIEELAKFTSDNVAKDITTFITV